MPLQISCALSPWRRVKSATTLGSSWITSQPPPSPPRSTPMLVIVTSRLWKSPISFSSSLKSRRKLSWATTGATPGVSIKFKPKPTNASTRAVATAAHTLDQPKNDFVLRSCFWRPLSEFTSAASNRRLTADLAIALGILEQASRRLHIAVSSGLSSSACSG